MATWVEDIEQALKNLGGQATLSQIYEEVKRIRKDPLPATWKASIRERIEAHSSDSQNFKGKDIFRKVDKGIWALKDRNSGHVGSEEKVNTLSSTSIAEVVLPQTQEDTNKKVPLVTPKLWGEVKDSKRQEFVIDNGLFPSESLNFPFSESFDTVANLSRTIKEYRDYVHPDANSWEEYILEFFHILGFNTTKVAPRLITVDILGENSSPKALVGIVHQDESLDEIIPGIDWASFLFFASKHFQTEYGILTNGCELRIYNLSHNQFKENSFWCNLDGLIKHERTDSFFTVHKVFEYIKGRRFKTVETEETLSDSNALRRVFWTQLLEKAKSRTSLHQNRTPGTDNWISTGAGKAGIVYSYVVRMEDAQVDLYIDRADYKWNKGVFGYFLQNKEEIEEIFGERLEWQMLEDKRAARVRFVINGLGLKNQLLWPELQERLINAMVDLEKAFNPFIRKLKI